MQWDAPARSAGPGPPVKNTQRLDYERLADTLRHHRLVAPEALRMTLHQCLSTGALFADLLVREGMVSDWELARLCSETFNLPFIPLENYQPDKRLVETLDVEFLRQYGLVPLDRFGTILTVAMPGMVPTDVLQALEEQTGCRVLPVVGTVQGNQRWLEENLPPPEALRELREATERGDEWAGVFDAGEAAVRSSGDHDTAALDFDLEGLAEVMPEEATTFSPPEDEDWSVLEVELVEQGPEDTADAELPRKRGLNLKDDVKDEHEAA
jgi:hypothetical protein